MRQRGDRAVDVSRQCLYVDGSRSKSTGTTGFRCHRRTGASKLESLTPRTYIDFYGALRASVTNRNIPSRWGARGSASSEPGPWAPGSRTSSRPGRHRSSWWSPTARAGVAHRAIEGSLMRAEHAAASPTPTQRCEPDRHRGPPRAPGTPGHRGRTGGSDAQARGPRRDRAIVEPETIVATNTSSISIETLAVALERPGRFLGMHFFNPVPASQLVELVRGPGTAPETVGRSAVGRPDRQADHRGRGLARLRQQPARPRDRARGDPDGRGRRREPGRHRRRDGPRLPLPDGPAPADRPRRPRRPPGRRRVPRGTLGDRFAPPQLLRDKVARGELGKKSGRGFFDWPDGGS